MVKKNIRNQNFIDDRLGHIEWLLMFRGWFSRYDLMAKFGIQEAAASRDIRKYKEVASGNLFLNHSIRRYEADFETFSPAYSLPVENIYSKLVDLEESQALGFDGCGIETIPRLAPLHHELAHISRAILNKKIIKIDYCSMTSGESAKHVAPHAMFDNDLKTYIRCYDIERSKFLDLVVGRISKIYGATFDAPEDIHSSQDSDWNAYLSLELAAHPKIKHKNAIERDMQMVNGVKKIDVRRSLAHYWLRRWCVDCSADGSMEDSAYQLHLKNHEVIDGVHGYFPGVNNHL